MSEWTYIGAAFGLTWAVLGGYALYLRGRMIQARQSLASAEGTS